MNRKKTSIIAIAVFVIAFAVIIVSRYYPPLLNTDSTGTIGVVKKYNAGQMSQKDVKLKNAMLKDVATVKESVERLKEYKLFITGLASDMGKWNDTIETAKKDNTKDLKDEKILTVNAAYFSDYKTYIEKNTFILDNTIKLLSQLSSGDTLNIDYSIENNITEYENFRIQIAQRFEKMIASIPSVHNAFVKNGIQGIVGNTCGAQALLAVNNTMTLAFFPGKPIGSNINLAVVSLSNGKIQSKLQQGKLNSISDLGNSMVGIYTCRQKDGVGSASLLNSTMGGKVYGNKDGFNSANQSNLGLFFANKPDYNKLTGTKSELGAN